MADYPSRLDVFGIGRDFILQRATKIDPRQIDIAGSDVNLFVGSQSEVAFFVVEQLAFCINRLLLDGAEGEDLDRYAFDRYQLPRKGASSAVGLVRIFRTSFAVGAGSVPAGTVLSTLNGVEYTLTTQATFGATTLTAPASVRAVQAGINTKAGANQIRRFRDVTTLFDRTLQVTNDDPTAGGDDRETDSVFRDRIRDFWRTARRGILAAIEFGARTVPGVTSAQAIEELTNPAQPARLVNLYISDPTGVANQQLADQVSIALLDYRAAGIAVIVVTSQPEIVPVKLHLTFRAGVDTSSVANDLRAAVIEFINSLPVNGTLALIELSSVVQRFQSVGLIVTQNTIVEPVGDVVPDPGKTLRTTPDDVVLV